MMHTPTRLLDQSMPTTRTQLAAAMIAVVAEDPEHRATGSLFYARGQAVCIQGALLAKLGYPFEADSTYGGGYRGVAQVMGFKHQSAEENALAVAQAGSDSELPWGWIGDVFARVLDGKWSYADGIAAVQNKTWQVYDLDAIKPMGKPQLDTLMQGVTKMQVWVDEMTQTMAHMDDPHITFNDEPGLAGPYAKKVLTW